uniref:Uncharacterized protein n=1 Tax=Arundo donax TaxID=35708 RepID=A0A0A9E5M3_ARUDO
MLPRFSPSPDCFHHYHRYLLQLKRVCSSTIEQWD